jgi:hypothetical protein
MALLTLALVLSTLAARRARRIGTSEAIVAGPGLRFAAAAAGALWVAVLVAGRWIAYTLSR